MRAPPKSPWEYELLQALGEGGHFYQKTLNCLYSLCNPISKTLSCRNHQGCGER